MVCHRVIRACVWTILWYSREFWEEDQRALVVCGLEGSRSLLKRKEKTSVLMIRLSRRGAPKKPVYRIVVVEKQKATDGRSVEVVGLYNPRSNPATIEMKKDRVDYWVSKGAKMSDTVARLYPKAQAPAVAAPVA
jgi:small subunit ribosomal protein S16